MNFFAYGTLMDERIFRDVTGETCRRAGGSLRGYVRRLVRGQVYPGIVECPEGSVSGVIYFDLPEKAWSRLDRFEGPMYARVPVDVWCEDSGTVEALTYVIRDAFRHVLTDEEWDFEAFEARGLAEFRREVIR